MPNATFLLTSCCYLPLRPTQVGCFSPYANIRPSGYPPRTRPASISTSLLTNVRAKGLARNPLLTISPDSSWMEDINRRALLPRNYQHNHHPFPSKPLAANQAPTMPLHLPANFGRSSTWHQHQPNSMNPSHFYSSAAQQTVSNTTSRHHLSFNDLLVRAYILNSNNNKK